MNRHIADLEGMRAGKFAGAKKVGTVRKEDSARLEAEAMRMEARLANLRTLVDQEKDSRTEGCRWKSSAKPTRSPKRKPGAAPKSAPPPAPVERGDFVELPAELPKPTSAAATAGLAAKLKQLSSEQQEASAEVRAFLDSLGLSRYYALFIEHGFDEMEVVREMEESHMEALGIAMGHKLKLSKRLRELRPTPPVQPRPAQSPKRPTPEAAEAGGSSLLNGTYDEADAAASFAAAVAEWRQDRAEEAEPEAGSFWAKVEAPAGWSNPADTAPESPTRDAAITQSPSNEKVCCYRCFRQFHADVPSEKAFCSAACAESDAAQQDEEQQRRSTLRDQCSRLESVLESDTISQAVADAEAAAERDVGTELAASALIPQPVARELLPAV